MAQSVSRRGLVDCDSCQNLVNVYRQAQHILLDPSTMLHVPAITDHHQAYSKLKIKSICIEFVRSQQTV